MAVLWDKYHIGFDRSGKKLYIGRGEVNGNRIKWNAKSEDRTEEIVIALMKKMKMCVEENGDPNKPFHCYLLEGFGKLVFIEDGYKFDLRPEPRKRR